MNFNLFCPSFWPISVILLQKSSQSQMEQCKRKKMKKNITFKMVLGRYRYPHHDIETSIWWYYMVELTFYWSLSISQWFDVKRKDFTEMFIHHCTTIALLSFSWTCNLTRYQGALSVNQSALQSIKEMGLQWASSQWQQFALICPVLLCPDNKK